MAKRPAKKPKPTVKAVVLPKTGVVHVAVPAGVVPVVVVDPVSKIVEIAPLPAKKKRSWWRWSYWE